MAERPIKKQNSEKSINSQQSPLIKGKQPITSSTASEFDDNKHQNNVGVTKSSFDFNAGKIQSQATDENLGHVSKNCNLYGPTICSETGRTIVPLLISKISPGNPPVKKVADAEPGDGNAPHQQHGVQHNENIEMDVDAGQQNNDGEGGNNNGGNGNENNGNDGNGNGGDDDVVEIVDDNIMEIEAGFRFRIYRFDLNVHNWIAEPQQVIATNIVANDYESWDELAHQIHHVYLDIVGDNNHQAPIANLRPYNCWPGCWTTFGYIEDGFLYTLSPETMPWADVRGSLNGLLVYRPVYDI